jgi:hypothetical protein
MDIKDATIRASSGVIIGNGRQNASSAWKDQPYRRQSQPEVADENRSLLPLVLHLTDFSRVH